VNADPILDRLTRLYPRAIDLSLDRVRRLMADLGSPQERLPPVIHVAGTKGKGSTVAFLRAMLEAHGSRVHAYTSPHLVRFNERIRLAGKLIDDDALTDVLEEVERINAGRPITFFEVTTAVAFLTFARTPADYVLLEVGLGGRLDATSLIERPAVVALTPISIDHTDFLGNTLAAIAGEKAGIMKPGVPTVVGPQPPEAAGVFAERAKAMGVSLFRDGAEWTARPAPGGMSYDGSRHFDLPAPALPGRHQVDNAGLAIATLENLSGFAPRSESIAEGLRKVEWPARLQVLTRGPLAVLVPAGSTLYLDGAHNEAAAAVVADWARESGDLRPLHLVCGLRATKDAAKFFARLASVARRVRTVPIPGDALSIAPPALAEAARAAGIADAEPAADLAAAMRSLADGPAQILICGSLYLAGAVLRDNQ
jgi:dihydrofolate synthase / folylpolyglutamate synthase